MPLQLNNYNETRRVSSSLRAGASLLCGMAFCTDALDEEVGGVGMESWGKGYVGQG